jgi:DNA-binding CsgD family transcriptional regulator
MWINRATWQRALPWNSINSNQLQTGGKGARMIDKLPLKQRLLRESDRLYQMYHHQHLSLTDIAEQYGCTRQYIQLIFKELGIDRRPRILALKNKPRRHASKYGFTDADDQFIRANFTLKNDNEMADELGKPVKAVTYRRLFTLKCRKNSRRNFSRAENRFIMNNYKKLSDGAIAKVLNRSLVSVAHHRNRVLHKIKRAIKNYSGDENEFISVNYQQMTDEQIANVLNRSKASVSIHRGNVLHLLKQSQSLPKGV